jgi:rhomboid protease GluP
MKSYARFLFSSVSGLISLASISVYVAIVGMTGEFGVPSSETLLAFGAKDPIAIADGEWWRTITSMFLHIGPLHLFMNLYAIRIIGPQIEETIGPWLFILLYAVSGCVGSIASALFSLSLSAGASGAIMGLLGFGLIIESLVGWRFKRESGSWPRMGAYLINTIFITLFGIFVPNIDNAAHFGGLICGAMFGTSVLLVRPNRLLPTNRLAAGGLLALIAFFTIHGMREITDSRKITQRLVWQAERAELPGESVFYYTRAMELQPHSPSILLKRGARLLEMDEMEYAIADLSAAVAKDPSLIAELRSIRDQIQEIPGREVQAYRLSKLLEAVADP